MEILLASALCAVIYSLVGLGTGFAGYALLKKIRFFSNMPAFSTALLAAALFPVLVTWCAHFALMRFGFLPPIAAFTLAAFTLYQLYTHGNSWRQAISLRPVNSAGLNLLIVCAISAIQLVTHWCYFLGGINNFDEYRGLAFTSAFAANQLQPAFPYDFTQPLSYGYYFYQYTAFLYSAVLGYGYPSVVLAIVSIFAICAFYFSFISLAKTIFRESGNVVSILAAFAMTFYGLDFFTASAYESEWWNTQQVTGMASQWNWIYHYLFAAALGFAAYDLLLQSWREKEFSKLCASAVFIVLAPLYATLLGVFMGMVYAIIAALFIFSQRAWMLRQFRQARTWKTVACICALILACVLPQLPIFLGRQNYLSFHFLDPSLWLAKAEAGHYVSMSSATLEEWIFSATLLFAELGIVHGLALIAAPIIIYKTSRDNPPASAVFLSFFIAILVSLSFITAQTNDWVSRSGHFGLVVISSLCVVYMLFYLKSFIKSDAAYSCIVIIIFLPGIYNFYSESEKRFRNCHPADVLAWQINRNTRLGEILILDSKMKGIPIRDIKPDNPWWHMQTHTKLPVSITSLRQYLETLVPVAGRALAGDVEIADIPFSVYRAGKKATSVFGGLEACKKRKYKMLSSNQAGLVFHDYSCEFGE